MDGNVPEQLEKPDRPCPDTGLAHGLSSVQFRHGHDADVPRRFPALDRI
jgi:hypothetical protein